MGGENAYVVQTEAKGEEWNSRMTWRVDRNEPVEDNWETDAR